MKKILVLVLAIIFVAGLCACSNGESSDNSATPDEASQSGTDGADDITYTKVSTPYADLKIRESVAESVETKVDSEKPYKITFKTKEDGTELLSIIFNGKEGDILGTIIGEKENTVVNMQVYDLDKDNIRYDKFSSYQIIANDIIKGLTNDYEFVSGTAVAREDNSTFDIKTSLVTLKYPAKWKDKVNVEVTDDTVKFTNDGTPLFDLYFKEADGFPIGTYKNTMIYVKDYDVKTDEQAKMLQDINVIINNLSKDPDFKITG